ncbi:uncharacterized protein CDAR_451931 [Caerostris darwini]|uniref:DUF19 domain-containing protein n=1 Tax=Caerostris darwini TaxID=1538125 RepID=A0AAV4WIG2_9ARAC|nr:uncharacterized protein CDAR_451931 [Caerostris darwini]
MKTSILCLFLMIGGTFAIFGENCNTDKCESLNTMKELQPLRYMPNKEQLERLCPGTLQYIDCHIEVLESCTGQRILQLSSSSNKSVSGMSKIILNTRHLIREICDEDTTLHKDYIENIECFRGYISFGPFQCRDEAEETARQFVENMDSINPDEDKRAERNCLTNAFEIGCIMTGLGRDCGDRARDLMMQILLTFKDSLLETGGCSGVRGATGLKVKFLESLNLSDEEKSKFQMAFELVKRRRR